MHFQTGIILFVKFILNLAKHFYCALIANKRILKKKFVASDLKNLRHQVHRPLHLTRLTHHLMIARPQTMIHRRHHRQRPLYPAQSHQARHPTGRARPRKVCRPLTLRADRTQRGIRRRRRIRKSETVQRNKPIVDR